MKERERMLNKAPPDERVEQVRNLGDELSLRLVKLMKLVLVMAPFALSMRLDAEKGMTASRRWAEGFGPIGWTSCRSCSTSSAGA